MPQSYSEKETIVLSALLHDIGKFAQRADEPLRSDERTSVDNLRQLCCSKGYMHQHVLWSGQFVRQVIKSDEIENLVLYHHLPENFTGEKRIIKIVRLADWLSSGERRDREPEDSVPEVKKEPLINIFSQIELDGIKIDEQYCPVKCLNNTLEGLFPVTSKDEALSQNINDENSFNYQWKKFLEESNKIIQDNPVFEVLYLRLLFLLEKYTLFIPSSAYVDKPEISLFHHLKSTAAIASCLYHLGITEEKIDRIKCAIKNKQYGDEILLSKDFLLLTGDISGIQDFIYSVTTEHALKGLRGRSFYLQLLSETIVRNILDEFNLTLCNLLYCAGGNFSILLPNLPETIERIDNLYREINRNIYSAHQGKLGVTISYLNISYKDFQVKFSENMWINIGKVSAREKKRRFYNIIDENFFGGFDIGGETKGCEICGDEVKDGNKCKLCESFEDLSIKIKNAKYMEIKKIDKVSPVKPEICSWEDLLNSLGYDYQFLQQKATNPQRTVKINDTDFLNENLTGFRFEAFYSPAETLEHIAEKADGIKKWAALRMDVDNLSRIFSEGLKNKTISRMNMLSHAISLFFSIRVMHIINQPEYKDKTIIVYSGGDDLFIIGAWSIMPEVAQEIYKEYRKYTGNHTNLTLSGGIFIAPTDKFPVYQSAKDAGEAEKKAKSAGKNKITFFDTALDWDEFEELKEIKEKIVDLLKIKNTDEKMSRSLLNILYSGLEEQELAKENKIHISRIWRVLYGLKRWVERNVEKDEQRKELIELRDKFIKNTELKENLDVAVRWADYLTRE